MGRAALRPRVRPRRVQHRRRVRLQHGGDGEQGSQHLQRPGLILASPETATDTIFEAIESVVGPTSTSTTGPATASLPVQVCGSTHHDSGTAFDGLRRSCRSPSRARGEDQAVVEDVENQLHRPHVEVGHGDDVEHVEVKNGRSAAHPMLIVQKKQCNGANVGNIENVMAVELGLRYPISRRYYFIEFRNVFGRNPLIFSLPAEQVLSFGPKLIQDGAQAISISSPRGALMSNNELVTGRLYGQSLFPRSLDIVRWAAMFEIPVLLEQAVCGRIKTQRTCCCPLGQWLLKQISGYGLGSVKRTPKGLFSENVVFWPFKTLGS